MKQKHLIIIAVSLLALAAACRNLGKIVVTTPDLGKIPDGSYRGNSRVWPVKVTLDVTMQNGAITSIEIIEHFNGRGKKAEALVPEIIKTQSLEVDAISGATGSSTAILKAVENALQ